MIQPEDLKKDLIAMDSLKDLTGMLEQTAAHTIARIRMNILDSRSFFSEAWGIYRLLKTLSPPPPAVVKKHLVVGIGMDWGMSGGLLGKVMKEVGTQQKEHQSDLLIAGKMSHEEFRGDTDHTVHLFAAPKEITLEAIQPIYRVIAGYAQVTIVYPRYESLSKQHVSFVSFTTNSDDESEYMLGRSAKGESSVLATGLLIDPKRFITDPSPQELSNYLNETIIGLTMHHYFLESILAYNAAQMVAMRNGYNNAEDESRKIKVAYNKAVRQTIDTKIREITSARRIQGYDVEGGVV